MENNKPSRPQGMSIGIGLVFGVVLYILTNEAVWIGVGIALGAALESGFGVPTSGLNRLKRLPA